MFSLVNTLNHTILGPTSFPPPIRISPSFKRDFLPHENSMHFLCPGKPLVEKPPGGTSAVHLWKIRPSREKGAKPLRRWKKNRRSGRLRIFAGKGIEGYGQSRIAGLLLDLFRGPDFLCVFGPRLSWPPSPAQGGHPAFRCTTGTRGGERFPGRLPFGRRRDVCRVFGQCQTPRIWCFWMRW